MLCDCWFILYNQMQKSGKSYLKYHPNPAFDPPLMAKRSMCKCVTNDLTTIMHCYYYLFMIAVINRHLAIQQILGTGIGLRKARKILKNLVSKPRNFASYNFHPKKMLGKWCRNNTKYAYVILFDRCFFNL